MIQQSMVLPPASKNIDPSTSYQAEEKANIKGQALQVYEALKRFPNSTAHELHKASGINYYIIQRRLSVLRTNNLARTVGKRICTVSNNNCMAWDIL